MTPITPPTVLIVNGPNLNLLGTREPEIYGTETLEDIERAAADHAKRHGLAVDFRQSNSEAELIGWVPTSAGQVAGLIVNIVSWRLLRVGAGESLNVEGAYLEVLADLIGSLGVILAALIIQFTGWPYADPIIGAAIGLFILPRAWHLGRRAIRVLVEAAPEGLDVDELRSRLASIDGVVGVHDLHVWTLTSEMDVATVHIVTGAAIDPHPILDEARRILEDGFDIPHATLQVEPDTHTGCAEVNW